ncbi:hypothetical protein [Acrocarpospora corrugata]|uniref:hypothetical protein n=1 Tax=Acrocarpospora corrugata TaxID=35763 RepID=UPI0012D2D57B|nr:hypothetical protein [Acrocarpospora corrugata]
MNVANQQAGIKILRGLLPLFNDKGVEKYFKEVKVFSRHRGPAAGGCEERQS